MYPPFDCADNVSAESSTVGYREFVMAVSRSPSETTDIAEMGTIFTAPVTALEFLKPMVAGTNHPRHPPHILVAAAVMLLS